MRFDEDFFVPCGFVFLVIVLFGILFYFQPIEQDNSNTLLVPVTYKVGGVNCITFIPFEGDTTNNK